MGSFILVPLLLGILYYGYYLWKVQQVPLLDPNLDQAGFVGDLCADDLLARVKTAALVALENVDDGTGLPVGPGNVTTSLVNAVPGQLGVDIKISISTPVMDSELLPLPNNGNLVNDVLLRLQNVRITTAGC